MITLTFAERHHQARLYAAQVRTRRAMGDSYEHARPWRGPRSLKAGLLTDRNYVSQSGEKEKLGVRA